MHLNSWISGSKSKHQKTCYPTTFRNKRVIKLKPKLPQHNLKTLFFVFSATLFFAHSFDHNSLHRTPNALILFFLETRLTKLSFDIKNVTFGPLSYLQYFFQKRTRCCQHCFYLDHSKIATQDKVRTWKHHIQGQLKLYIPNDERLSCFLLELWIWWSYLRKLFENSH